MTCPTKSNLIKNLLMKSFLESLGNSMDRAVLRFVVDRERENNLCYLLKEKKY